MGGVQHAADDSGMAGMAAADERADAVLERAHDISAHAAIHLPAHPAALCGHVTRILVEKVAMTDNLLRLREVSTRTGLARSTIYKLMGLGRFPAQKRLTESCVAWLQSDIDRWIDERPSGKLGALSGTPSPPPL